MQTVNLCQRSAMIALLLTVTWFAGCATDTVKPTFPTASGLQRPDRVLVYEFAVTPDDLKQGVIGSQLDRPAAQTQEEISLGRAMAKSLAENLVSELRSRGINALAYSDAAAPGNTTATIRGGFITLGTGAESRVGFGLSDNQIRTRIQIFQGTGVDVRLVSEAESVTQSSLERGATASGAVEADAKRAAQALAERVATYYRKQGWLK
jgi:hypothetical protein